MILRTGESLTAMAVYRADESGEWESVFVKEAVGDEVEANVGEALFEGKIAQVVGSTYNVVFFDGDRENGLERDQIKLLNPPLVDEDEIDTSELTPKEIKRPRKNMKKKKGKR